MAFALTAGASVALHGVEEVVVLTYDHTRVANALETRIVQGERIGILRDPLQSADIAFLEGIELSALEDDMLLGPCSGQGKGALWGE